MVRTYTGDRSKWWQHEDGPSFLLGCIDGEGYLHVCGYIHGESPIDAECRVPIVIMICSMHEDSLSPMVRGRSRARNLFPPAAAALYKAHAASFDLSMQHPNTRSI